MTRQIYALAIAAMFALSYGEDVVVRAPSLAPLVLGVTFLLWWLAYLLPALLFRYDNEQPAPVVLSQLMRRAGLAITLVVAAGLFVLSLTGLWLDLPFLEELYATTLIGLVVFHGFGGTFAYHVVYLQQTRQYNSNQLAAVLIAITLLLFVLALFFLNLDFATPHDAHVQRRDLLLLTAVLIGYGWTIYKVAHH